jgi:hypothetical protein
MASDQQFWFCVKSHGWGWGLPVRWQGWAVLVAYYLLVFVGIVRFTADNSVRSLLIYLVAITLLLMIVVAWKGERPVKWRWGGK